MRIISLLKILVVLAIGAVWFFGGSGPQTAAPPKSSSIESWLGPQNWQKRRAGPVIALGAQGAFDDMHVFAPSVVLENGIYRLWYPGSRGTVADRIFRVGLATSSDGIRFDKADQNPVYSFGERKSIVTPTVLRDTDAAPIRENGQLRMWFTSVDFRDGVHRLHDAVSSDGLEWSDPSESLLENAYAPSVIKDGLIYRMWYTDVGVASWTIRHASSPDGKRWDVTPEPVLTVEQDWEHRRLFYPTVVKVDGLYLLWYASYWIEAPEADKTAIGFAVSEDGIHWRRNPYNPVLRPDPDLPWESHYNSSQSVMRLADGAWRIWYGSRKEPPFVNKYFAIATATWSGPDSD